MKPYHVLLHHQAFDRAKAYHHALQTGEAQAGHYLQNSLSQTNVAQLTPEAFLEHLIRTKRPQIFAESAVSGDGSDWNQTELSILGDVGIATSVTVFDNGRHTAPTVHNPPFEATLLFVAGALLRSAGSAPPADWAEATRDGAIDPTGYYQLYERRLLPSFLYANELAGQQGKRAFITLPGLGCGQFAGPFHGQLGNQLKQVLIRLLHRYGRHLPHLQAVYFDPYSECQNERYQIEGISLLVRPLTQGNAPKTQLCPPEHYAEAGDDFSGCTLFSFVAWDHVSWPGNDFYIGSRATDDGVKAAATNVMTVMTGLEGHYNPHRFHYQPPANYRTWDEVISAQALQLQVQDRLRLYPLRDTLSSSH